MQMTHVPQRFDKEASVQQMHDCVLSAASILIHWQPLLQRFLTPGCLSVLWIGVAQEVPGRADERIHRICLAGRGTTTDWTGGIHKVWLIAQRRLTSSFKLHVFWQMDRQLILWYRYHSVLLTIYDRNRRTPVSL